MKYSFHLLFRAMSHYLHSTHIDLIFTVFYFSFAHRLRLKVDHVRNTLRPLHEALEVTVLRIQNLAQVMSPAGLSTTRSSLSKRLTSHCCLRLEIPLKALLCRRRLGRRTNSCSADFTTVLAEATSKCGTITNLPLWKRRVAVNFISKSELHRHKETCNIAPTSGKIGTRRIFRERATWWLF